MGEGASVFTLPASITATTRPGKPAPDPRSTQVLACGAKAKSWAEFGEVAVPNGVQRARGNQIDGFLPVAQKLLVDGQALEGLTGNMKDSGKVIRAADGAYVMLMAGPLGHAASA